MLKNKQGDSLLADILMYLLLGLFTFICVFPFYYVLINTISDNDLAAKGRILFIPIGIHFENYVRIFQLNGLLTATLISVLRTVLGTLLTVIGSSFLGYAMSRNEYWHRKFWYRFITVTMYFNAGLIPWFITMKNLHMVNNFLAYIIPGIVAPFYVLLIRTYYISIPAALEESAELDGAGYLVRYTRIMLPLCVPIIATISVFSAVDQWNSFMDTLFLMRNPRLYTLQFMLFQFLNEANAIATSMRQGAAVAGKLNAARALTPTSVRMTVSIVVMIPIILVYPFLQRFFIRGIMIGAIKG